MSLNTMCFELQEISHLPLVVAHYLDPPVVSLSGKPNILSLKCNCDTRTGSFQVSTLHRRPRLRSHSSSNEAEAFVSFCGIS